jgi:hypothetical protein
VGNHVRSPDYMLKPVEPEDDCFQFTLTQRVLGFATTALIGGFASFLSLIAISVLRVRKFGLLFAIFNLTVILSTGFLVGFRKQLKSLTEKKRAPAALGMLIGLSITIFFAFKWKKLIGVVLGFSIAFRSFAYSALSYLPWGDRILQKCTQCLPCMKLWNAAH